MNAGRGVGGDAGPSRHTGNTTGEPRKKKKKAKGKDPIRSSGPVPAPYLALAPSPVSSTPRDALADIVRPVANHLILPSTFLRARSTTNLLDEPAPAPTPQPSRRMYAANLAAPPLIMPGGTSATPRIQEVTNPPMRRRDGRRRSEEGLRGLAQANQSMASLGSLGRIMESDTASGEPPVQRRRRRVVREEPRRQRQPTVSSREEGRAIGLARGASMRRLSVWDGLPDAAEAPPPFVVPIATPSQPVPADSPPVDDDDPPPPFEARGRSPPPTWEQATGAAPLPHSTLSDSIPLPISTSAPSSPGTQYASAPESPPSSVGEEEGTEEEREDRRVWNADISAGYSLVERVEREAERKRLREAEEPLEQNEALAAGSTPQASSSLVQSVSATPVSGSPPVVVTPSPSPLPVTEETSPLVLSASSTPAQSATIITTPTSEPSLSTADSLISNPAPPAAIRPVSPPPTATNLPSRTPPSNVAVAGPSNTLPKSTTAKPKVQKPKIVKSKRTSFPKPHSAITGRSSGASTPTISEVHTSFVEVEEAEERMEPEIATVQKKPKRIKAVKPAQRKTSVIESEEKSSEPKGTMANDRAQGQAETLRSLTGGTSVAKELYQAETLRALNGEASSSAPPSPVKSPNPLISSDTAPPQGNDEDSSVTLATPKRQLTRGKAIRRSSSGLTLTSDSTLRALASPESPLRPLFEDTAFDWRNAGQGGQDAISPSRVRPGHKKSSSSMAILRSPPQSSHLDERGEMVSSPPLGSIEGTLSSSPAPVSGILPPHRQAALRRRELSTKAPDMPAETKVPQPAEIPTPTLPPLIDLSARSVPYQSPPMAVPRELYQLFDEDEPIAESSAQAVARVEQAAVYRAIKRDRREWAVDEILVGDSPERPPDLPVKRPPPPPPTLRRNLISTTVGANLTPRRSIIRSADSPVTPRPLRQISSGSQDRPPVLPTRRPAPPPPLKYDTESVEPPALPPRPTPEYRPEPDRRDSTISIADTVSSLSDSRTVPFGYGNSASPRKPRGPRPPPPPPRWARIIMPLNDVKSVRPASERTQSDSASLRVEHVRESPRRSNSEQDLNRSPIEYTDLDVLVSRLEGSGREYEGFSQITAFLGPGKSLAATPEALATLLPGLVFVDSRRVTPQGKVKLKLSLLGVRVTKCPICLGQFKKDDKGVLLPECGHVSHEECAEKWFREDSRCFVCRVPLLSEPTVDDVTVEGRRGEGVV